MPLLLYPGPPGFENRPSNFNTKRYRNPPQPQRPRLPESTESVGVGLLDYEPVHTIGHFSTKASDGERERVGECLPVGKAGVKALLFTPCLIRSVTYTAFDVLNYGTG